SRPSSRTSSCNWVSKRWTTWGVRSARRKRTMRRPFWAMTGIKRTVKGNREVAKWVAASNRVAVARSIEASFLVRGRGRVTPAISRGSRLVFQGPGQGPGGLRAAASQEPPQILGKPWHWRDCTHRVRVKDDQGFLSGIDFEIKTGAGDDSVL